MEFITAEDVVDDIVTCTESDIDEANSFLLNIAKRFRVTEARIKIPAVYTVKRLGAVYALYIACVRSIGKDNITALNTESTRMDIYAQKARFFKEEMDSIEQNLSANDFTGNFSEYDCMNVPVWRG